MGGQYFETTTLYALGQVLAIERLFALEGVYPQLATHYPELGEFLRKHRVEYALGNDFYQYDRLALAEAVMELGGDHFRASTYLEFRRRYESKDSGEGEWLAPARKAIESISAKRQEVLLNHLQKVAMRIAKRDEYSEWTQEQAGNLGPLVAFSIKRDTGCTPVASRQRSQRSARP